MTDKMREAFELWWKAVRRPLMLPDYVKEDDWETWQAAQAEQAAELERLRKDAERWRAALVISQATLCRPDTREPRVNSMLNAYRRAVNTGVGMTKAIDAAIAADGGDQP